jgi:hypothetical protein
MDNTLSDLARIELETLANEGITPSWDDVCELNALGWQVLTPDTRRELSRGRPVEVSGVTLRPLTMAAWAWFERVGETCRDQNAALAYAMAHGYTPEIDTANRDDVRRWHRTIKATDRELTLAIAEVIDQDRKPDLPPKGNTPSMAEQGAVAIAHCGGTPDMWERHVRIGYIGDVLAAIGRSSGAVDGKPDPTDPRIMAQAALIHAVHKIRQRHAQAIENAANGMGDTANG